MHLTLAFNPSHLEIVNPVVEGSVRARQHRRGDTQGDQVLPVLIHGDAAIAGQGVNQEVLNMAQTRGYLHRRHDPHRRQQPDRLHDLRSARHARHDSTAPTSRRWSRRRSSTSTATIRRSCLLAIEIALDYRQQFHKDVFIDLVCFRRLGHNEAGRADGHAAADVQEDRAASGHAQALRRPARRARAWSPPRKPTR